ncbi:MAG TPA: DUF262 domain-containing protein [Bacteroidales bacterium]|mgnify:CR=1 FL=1|nr:DUF262 domain-containing protein [Bacteroidales bacterium]
MKFEAISIKKAVIDIEEGRIFLPPIQRNFVWDYDRIVNLFDSLYRNYPIGNCIFWRLKPETSRHYPLYKFIKEFTENKNKPVKNEHVPQNLLQQDVYAVVDGQQRLSSFFIGLAGIYKYKKSGKGLQNIESNFIPSTLYFNLLANDGREDNDQLFEFLGIEDASFLNDKNLWFEVGNILTWKSIDKAEDYVKEIEQKVNGTNKKTLISKFEARKDRIINSLQALYEMVNDNRIYFFDVNSQNLDEVVDIFTRVNSGGMTLKKSDLLFSILIAQWNEGRDEIKDLVESLRDSNINISQDFVMRACLVLSDLPVKYKLESFKQKNIVLIKKNWNDIKNSLLKLADLLPEIGYKDLPNLSDNALIPIAYYIMKGGKFDTIKAKKALQLYYVVSQVNGIYGGQSDQILEKIRAEIKKQLSKDKNLNFQELSEIKLPGGKSLKLTIQDLNEIVEDISYGSPHAYFILSLIYPTVDFKIRKYEVDHIHPRSKFNRSNLISIGITDEETIEYWKNEKCNQLPNLQLLGDKDNNNKRSKTLNEYIQAKTTKERADFIKDNLLPPDKRLRDLIKFDDFFEYRKKQLINKLKKHFDV